MLWLLLSLKVGVLWVETIFSLADLFTIVFTVKKLIQQKEQGSFIRSGGGHILSLFSVLTGVWIYCIILVTSGLLAQHFFASDVIWFCIEAWSYSEYDMDHISYYIIFKRNSRISACLWTDFFFFQIIISLCIYAIEIRATLPSEHQQLLFMKALKTRGNLMMSNSVKPDIKPF